MKVLLTENKRHIIISRGEDDEVAYTLTEAQEIIRQLRVLLEKEVEGRW